MDNLTIIHSNGHLSSKDVCRFFGISESTLRDWEKRKIVKSFSIDGMKQYSVKELDILYSSMKERGKITTFYPDWFYWSYESELGKKILSWDDYLTEFACLKKPFEEVDRHKLSTDHLVNYEFAGMQRSNSLLSHHSVLFNPKSDHPWFKQAAKNNEKINISPLRFDVYFETVNANPVGLLDRKDQSFVTDYVRLDPYYIICCATCWGL